MIFLINTVNLTGHFQQKTIRFFGPSDLALICKICTVNSRLENLKLRFNVSNSLNLKLQKTHAAFPGDMQFSSDSIGTCPRLREIFRENPRKISPKELTLTKLDVLKSR